MVRGDVRAVSLCRMQIPANDAGCAHFMEEIASNLRREKFSNVMNFPNV